MWPAQASDDGEELLRAYLLAVEDYFPDDVQRAVDLLVKGVAPGVNPSYRPKPSEVGAECRRVMNLRLDSETRGRKPALPPPIIEHSPDERARMVAIAQAAVAGLTASMRTEDAEAEKRRKAGWQKTNERFQPDMSQSAMKQRLGFETGDADGDRGVA